jgi:hypothetical protein
MKSLNDSLRQFEYEQERRREELELDREREAEVAYCASCRDRLLDTEIFPIVLKDDYSLKSVDIPFCSSCHDNFLYRLSAMIDSRYESHIDKMSVHPKRKEVK